MHTPTKGQLISKCLLGIQEACRGYLRRNYYATRKLQRYVGQGESKVWYQGILKATVSGVFEDLKFKISEGLKLN